MIKTLDFAALMLFTLFGEIVWFVRLLIDSHFELGWL
jgi:hypothetical protein